MVALNMALKKIIYLGVPLCSLALSLSGLTKDHLLLNTNNPESFIAKRQINIQLPQVSQSRDFLFTRLLSRHVPRLRRVRGE